VALRHRAIAGEAGEIQVDLAEPSRVTSERLLVLCHGLPLGRGGGRTASSQLPALAERVAEEVGWPVAVASLRGVAGTPGTFSASGWRADLACVLDELVAPEAGAVLVGFGFGGALALAVAAHDERIRAVATLATPADLASWCGPSEEFARACRRAGVVGDEPLLDPDALVADVVALDPLGAAGALPPRRFLIVHGEDDRIVPAAAARALLEAAGGRAELRIIQGAGHWLRADPRMVATLLGWLDRFR
jgi:uncharacterized protein